MSVVLAVGLTSRAHALTLPEVASDRGFEAPVPVVGTPAGDGGRGSAHEPDVAPRVVTDGLLTAFELLDVYELAGVPVKWRVDLGAVAFCESGFTDPETNLRYWQADAVGDEGRSLGLHQLNWATWAPEALRRGYIEEDELDLWADPVVNTRVALAVVEYDLDHGYDAYAQWTCQP